MSITINTLRIGEFSNSLIFDIETDIGFLFTKVLLWDYKSYKDYSKAIDLTPFLARTGNTEGFTILASDISATAFEGAYYVEFTTDEPSTINSCGEDTSVTLGMASSFIKYHECLLNSVTSLKVDSCGVVESLDCNNCNINTFYLGTLLQSVDAATTLRYYTELNSILCKMDEVCDNGCNCPDYTSTSLVNGLGYGTFDNSVIPI